MRCSDGLEKDETKQVGIAPDVHDVIFVVEERTCLEHQKAKIANIARTIGQKQRFSMAVASQKL